MRSMAFKVFLFLILAPVSGLAMSSGIPVQCANCVDATERAAVTVGSSIGGHIEAQTKALELLIEYLLHAQEYNAGARATAIAETEDAKRTERALGLGAKPFGACSQYEATAMTAQRQVAEELISTYGSAASKRRNRQSRELPPGEPRRQKNVSDVIAELDDPDESEDGATELLAADYVFPEKPIPESGLEGFWRKLMLLLNPFPVVTPSEQEIAEIKEHGTTAELEALAQSLAMQRRQEVAMKAVTKNVERNIQTLDPDAMQGMIEIAKPYLADPSLWSGKLSPNQVDELMHGYRASSPDWYTEIMASESEFALMREQVVMQAQMLQSMWELRTLLQHQLSLAGYAETREISQAGLMSR